MKKTALRPGKKCKKCNGNGCAECNQRGFTVNAKRRVAVKKTSSKRRELNLEYGKRRKAFMLQNPRCQVLGPSGKPCSKPSTDCHHRKGRGKYYLEATTWLSTCADCHRLLHTDLQGWARRMQYLVNPVSKGETPSPSPVFLPYHEDKEAEN
jgi:hypothetical protein